MKKRFFGQVSAEILIIISIVVVIALFAGAFIATSSSGSPDVRMKQSKAYWQGQAAPLKITSWAIATRNSLSAVETNLSLTVLNPTRETLTIRALSLSPGSFNNVYDSNQTWAGFSSGVYFKLYPGQSVSFYVMHYQSAPPLYIPPKYAEIWLNITYDSGIRHSVQVGSFPIIEPNAYLSGDPAGPGDGACPAGQLKCPSICCPVSRCIDGACKGDPLLCENKLPLATGECCDPNDGLYKCSASCPCINGYYCDQSSSPNACKAKSAVACADPAPAFDPLKNICSSTTCAANFNCNLSSCSCQACINDTSTACDPADPYACCASGHLYCNPATLRCDNQTARSCALGGLPSASEYCADDCQPLNGTPQYCDISTCSCMLKNPVPCTSNPTPTPVQYCQNDCSAGQFCNSTGSTCFCQQKNEFPCDLYNDSNATLFNSSTMSCGPLDNCALKGLVCNYTSCNCTPCSANSTCKNATNGTVCCAQPQPYCANYTSYSCCASLDFCPMNFSGITQNACCNSTQVCSQNVTGNTWACCPTGVSFTYQQKYGNQSSGSEGVQNTALHFKCENAAYCCDNSATLPVSCLPSSGADTTCCNNSDVCRVGAPGNDPNNMPLTWACCGAGTKCGSEPADTYGQQNFLCCNANKSCVVPSLNNKPEYSCCPSGADCLNNNFCCPQARQCNTSSDPAANPTCCLDSQLCINPVVTYPPVQKCCEKPYINNNPGTGGPKCCPTGPVICTSLVGCADPTVTYGPDGVATGCADPNCQLDCPGGCGSLSPPQVSCGSVCCDKDPSDPNTPPTMPSPYCAALAGPITSAAVCCNSGFQSSNGMTLCSDSVSGAKTCCPSNANNWQAFTATQGSACTGNAQVTSGCCAYGQTAYQDASQPGNPWSCCASGNYLTWTDQASRTGICCPHASDTACNDAQGLPQCCALVNGISACNTPAQMCCAPQQICNPDPNSPDACCSAYGTCYTNNSDPLNPVKTCCPPNKYSSDYNICCTDSEYLVNENSVPPSQNKMVCCPSNTNPCCSPSQFYMPSGRACCANVSYMSGTQSCCQFGAVVCKNGGSTCSNNGIPNYDSNNIAVSCPDVGCTLSCP